MLVDANRGRANEPFLPQQCGSKWPALRHACSTQAFALGAPGVQQVLPPFCRGQRASKPFGATQVPPTNVLSTFECVKLGAQNVESREPQQSSSDRAVAMHAS